MGLLGIIGTFFWFDNSYTINASLVAKYMYGAALQVDG
jgi:hypothetical protein